MSDRINALKTLELTDERDGVVRPRFYDSMVIQGHTFRVHLSCVKVSIDAVHGKVAEGIVTSGHVLTPGLGQRNLCPGEIRKWYIAGGKIQDFGTAQGPVVTI